MADTYFNSALSGDVVSEVTRVEVALQTADRDDEFRVLDFLLDRLAGDRPDIYLDSAFRN